MKVFNRKDVFAIINIEEAEKYLNSKGYFGDSIKELNDNIQQGFDTELEEISCNDDAAFVYKGKGKAEYNSLFLPIEKVRVIKEEKKYIPFKAMFEFVNTVDKRTGDTIRIRAKKDNPLESVYLITGFTETHAHELKYIHLSAISYSPQELLKNYEYFANGTWHPFGIEE